MGPYQPDGREIWVIRHDGTFTDPGKVPNRAAFDQVVEVLRPAAICGMTHGQVQWADRPNEWPQG